MWRFHLAIAGAFAVSGCSNIFARPADLEALQETVQKLDARLAKIPHLSDSDLLSDERGQRYESTRKFIRDKQCSAGVANPVFLISLPIKLSLKGSFEDGGNVRLSGLSPEEGQGTRTSGPQNSFEIPMRISTLAGFPNEYLKEMSSLLETKGLPGETAQRLRKQIPESYDKLTDRVEQLVNGFDARACPRRVYRPATIFVPPTF
jgi:hypothetical protein